MLLAVALVAAAQAAPQPGKPVGDVGEWIRASDQPRYGAGAVRFKVLFTPEGTPDRCDIVETTGDRDVERAACTAVKKRFRYEPSLSSAGKPVHRILERAGYFGVRSQDPDLSHIPTPVMYALGSKQANADNASGLVAEIDEAGAIVACTGPDLSVAAVACPKLAEVWKPLPEVDSAKKPVRYLRSILVTL